MLSRLFGTASNQTITEEELITIVEEAQQGGGIDSQEGELLRNAIEFNELKAADILTPRIDITGISADASRKNCFRFAATGFPAFLYTRAPLTISPEFCIRRILQFCLWNGQSH